MEVLGAREGLPHPHQVASQSIPTLKKRKTQKPQLFSKKGLSCYMLITRKNKTRHLRKHEMNATLGHACGLPGEEPRVRSQSQVLGPPGDPSSRRSRWIPSNSGGRKEARVFSSFVLQLDQMTKRNHAFVFVSSSSSFSWRNNVPHVHNTRAGRAGGGREAGRAGVGKKNLDVPQRI